MGIKVGVIGCGTIAELRHAPEYKANKNAEIIAFCDPQLVRAEKMAEKFGGRAYTDYRKVLSLVDLDAVSICTSNNTHACISIEALNSGKHVLCEKPMATNLEDAKAMINAAREAEKFLMVGHNQRFAGAHIRAREILMSDELGRVLSFKTCFGHSGPEMWGADKGKHTWFFKKNLSGMGVLADLGMHKADLIRWLIDEEIDEVSALVSTRDKRNDEDKLIEIEDNAMCILKSRSGIVGNLSSSWTYYGQEDNSTVVYCEKGIMKIYSNPEYQIIIEKKNGDKVYYNVGEIQTNRNQTKSGVIDAFVNSVIYRVQPEISGEDGYEALSIIMACLESNEKKACVEVRHLINDK